MQYGQPTVRDQSFLHTFLVLGGIVLMVIVGLLGMHTFSAESMGHDGAAMSQATTTATAHSESAMSGAAAAECAASCRITMDYERGHDEMMNACVLALLVGILLLLPPMLLRRFGPILWPFARLWALPATSAVPRAPSLTFLSISRT